MKLSNNKDDHFYKNRYFYLLAATVLQIFLVSFFPDRNNLFVNSTMFTLFMLANINFIRHNKNIVLFMVVFALISTVIVWIPSHTMTGQKFRMLDNFIVILFISVIIYMIIVQILKSKIVSVNVILGVITIYILLGMLAAESNQLIYYFDNNAFTGNLNPADLADLRYFSYVTMTTLGYGDIAPLSHAARAVAVFFSLIGQIYLAVVIALIVGKFVSHSDKKEMK